MTSAKEDTLSPDELRKRLYQTFKSKGVLDTLKTQLRNQLIQELKHPPLTGGQPVPRPVHVKSEPRLVSACNSIVADHLRSSGYEYTLSVFYPECGLGKDEVVMTGDLLQLLRINPESALYRSVSADKDNSDKGFLISLLTQLTHYYSHSQCHDADTQTTSGASYGESLVEKMKVIDKEYESLNYSGDKWFSFQSKLDAYRKEIEAQMQEDMNTKMQHFKDVEVATVRMEEKKQFHKEFDKLKQDLERTYEMKAKALMEREKNAIDRLQKQQEIEEKNVYMQRQSVLKEIETVRNRENELRMRVEAFEKTCQIHEQKVKTTEELLRSKELAVKTMEETYDQRLRNELSRYQLELKDEFLKRTEKLTENENIIKVESVRIQKESAIIDGKLEEHCRASSELRRLQVELDTAQQQISLLTQQNGLLRERLEATSDYSSLKGEKAELQGQQRLLKKQLEEAQEENRLLHADSGRPSKQQLALQMELRRLQSARSLDEEAFENQKQVLQAQLQGEVERGAQLKAQLTECEERSRWMTNHIEEMKMQLRQTQQALENEVLRNPKPSLVDRSILEFSTDKLLPPDIYVDRALLRATVVCDEVREAGGPLRGRRSPWSDSPDTDLDLVAEAKARIQELQEEAETLEEAYRNYHQRAVRSTISPVLPLGPRSPQRASPSRRPGSPLRKQAAQHPHARSPNRPKVSQRPLSPRTARTLSSAPCDTRTTPHVQQRVTFLEDADQPQSAILSDHSPHSLTETLRDGRPQAANSPPPRRLSPTPHSSSRNTLQREIAEEAVGSPMALPELSLDRRAPPHSDLATTGDFSPELSPPCSPQLKSTTRDQSSPPKLQPVFSSSDSSPQPEKISLDDLTVMSEPGHIPQLLLDTAIPLCAEAPDSPTVPRPQDLPEDPMELQGQAEVPQASGEDAMIQEDNDDEEEEEEEERWERERRKRLEERQRKQAEAREREVQELERLEKEMLLQEMEQPELKQGEEGEAEIKKKEEEQAQGAANDGEEPMGGNPLEKYMALVLEAREKQHDQSPGREEAGRVSPEAEGLSEEKDNSVAAFSHKDEDEDDDDFW